MIPPSIGAMAETMPATELLNARYGVDLPSGDREKISSVKHRFTPAEKTPMEKFKHNIPNHLNCSSCNSVRGNHKNIER